MLFKPCHHSFSWASLDSPCRIINPFHCPISSTLAFFKCYFMTWSPLQVVFRFPDSAVSFFKKAGSSLARAERTHISGQRWGHVQLLSWKSSWHPCVLFLPVNVFMRPMASCKFFKCLRRSTYLNFEKGLIGMRFQWQHCPSFWNRQTSGTKSMLSFTVRI